MTVFRQDPPPDELRDMLYYEDGNLYWHECYRLKNGRRSEKPLGTLSKSGYKITRLSVNGVYRAYLIHRLIWWIVKGEWPAVLDHKNRNILDNRIENLRECSQGQNNYNRSLSANSETGYIGVTNVRKGYRVALMISGLHRSIYGYKDAETAALARDVLAHLLHGDFANLNLLDRQSITIN